ncbi:glyoxylate/hydroxypyruvate reductase A [Paracoccus sp. SCSIO 75233]|uniref:2-hydroxyacid dehydrogenase n=1 Tax=Paracoccus sp. SCSIO 75233 TaxID=3017782 RepID=UPI0022F07BC1|nr:glyoxylate/hydroxypyruvate reductase A [Paracoccus sp. SCSIO 75233]WBU51804.1 glyoxylate/hydroxypyruvate reductase A [Paracoccus sp. SCSIO 75233]
MRVLFAASDWEEWSAALRTACPEMELLQAAAPDSVDAILYAPSGPGCDFAAYPSARLVQSLWAGVERIAPDPSLTQPLARMVDPGLEQGMTEYCTGWVLRAHLGMDHYAQDGKWRGREVPPLAKNRRVTVLGAGALGGAVAGALVGLGFDVATWSLSGRGVDGATAFAGDQLEQALARAEILVLLLPDTAETRDILNGETLALLPQGCTIINPGRGTLIDDDALLASLDRGHISHAVLDVFRTEPLPPDHPYWAHPQVTVTPHIASDTRPETASLVVAENLRRVMRGESALYLVDRGKGY